MDRRPESWLRNTEAVLTVAVIVVIASGQWTDCQVTNPSLDFISSNRKMIRYKSLVAGPKTRQSMSRLKDETASADAASR